MNEICLNGLSRRDIDMGLGVLIALRGCTERQAFNEIAAAVADTGVGLSRICHALVLLASDATAEFDHRTEVIERWGDLLAGRSAAHAHAV